MGHLLLLSGVRGSVYVFCPWVFEVLSFWTSDVLSSGSAMALL